MTSLSHPPLTATLSPPSLSHTSRWELPLFLFIASLLGKRAILVIPATNCMFLSFFFLEYRLPCPWPSPALPLNPFGSWIPGECTWDQQTGKRCLPWPGPRRTGAPKTILCCLSATRCLQYMVCEESRMNCCSFKVLEQPDRCHMRWYLRHTVKLVCDRGTVNYYIKSGTRQGLCHQENYTWNHTLIL